MFAVTIASNETTKWFLKKEMLFGLPCGGYYGGFSEKIPCKFNLQFSVSNF